MARLTACRIESATCCSSGLSAAISADVPPNSSIWTSRRDRLVRSALRHVFVDKRYNHELKLESKRNARISRKTFTKISCVRSLANSASPVIKRAKLYTFRLKQSYKA